MSVTNLNMDSYLTFLKDESINVADVLPTHRNDFESLIVEKIVKKEFFGDLYYVPNKEIGEGKLVQILEELVNMVPIGETLPLDHFEDEIENLCERFDYYMGRGYTRAKRYERVVKYGSDVFNALLENRGKNPISQKDDEISSAVAAHFEEHILQELLFDSVIIGQPLYGSFMEMPIKTVADVVISNKVNKEIKVFKLMPYWGDDSFLSWKFSRPDVVLAVQKMLLSQKYDKFIEKGWAVKGFFLPLSRNLDDRSFSTHVLTEDAYNLAILGVNIELPVSFDTGNSIEGFKVNRRIKGLVDFLNIRTNTNFYENYYL